MKKTLFYLLPVLLLGTALASNVILTTFNAGELSPELGGRIDFNKYSSGLQTALNAVPMAQGGITRRPGTEYLGTTKSNGEARLIPFVFSEDQAYMLEFGDIYMRVWADGGTVLTVDSDTELLLHSDDFDTSTAFVDSGTNTHTVTVNGDTEHDTSQLKFGESSGYYDGTGDYLEVSDDDGVSDYWHMDTDEFTIDFWIRAYDVSGTTGFFQQYDDGDNRVYLNYASGTWTFGITDAASSQTVTGTSAIVAGTWYHIAVIRGWAGDGDTFAITVNGTAIATEASVTDDWPDLAGAFYVGANSDGNYTGWMDEFRISKAARWTATFDVPTFPHPSGGDDSGTAYELVTPYDVGDLEDLNYVQSADTMYIVHPDHMPYKLTRTAHNAWTITAFAWTDATSAVADRWPPLQNINITDTTLDPSATTGVGIDVVASAAFFSAGHVGSYFKFDNGLFVITAVTDSTNAVATVVDDLDGHVATADWYESSWSMYRGFPSVVTFFEERLVFANNDNEPQSIWMSESDDYEDFIVNDSVTDTDGVTVTILAERVNAIKWMVSDRKLLIGTTGGEWWMTGDTSENAITPTSVLVRNATSHGSGNVRPIKAGGAVLFVQRPGLKVRQYQYRFDTDSYQATNVSVLAEHITEGNAAIKEMAYQQQPHQLIWCRLNSGNLATLSYMPEHDVYAWARHDLVGTVESLATIPGTTDDELYIISSRTINSTGVRHIERLKGFVFNSQNLAVYADSALTYNGTAATTITGLSHLEGESVDVYADGAVVTGKTVASGQITLSTAASIVTVGLNYVTDIETMRLAAGSPLQSIQGRLKRINKVTARFYKTLSATAGPDSSNLDTVISSYTAESDEEIRISHGVDSDGVVFIRQSQPGPMTILALMLDVEVY